jgi:hypothetical protein
VDTIIQKYESVFEIVGKIKVIYITEIVIISTPIGASFPSEKR